MTKARFRIKAQLFYRLQVAADILLLVEAMADDRQRIVREELRLASVLMPPAPAVEDGTRPRWVYAVNGPLSIDYVAEVEVASKSAEWANQPATARHDLPRDLAPYLLASRYCDPEAFGAVLADEFGLASESVADGAMIARIVDWIGAHLRYEPVSDERTTAIDTYVSRRGVCRDYTHLLIAMARAAGVPARFVAAYAWDLTPPDFHAVAELWIGGRWHMIDATRLAPEQWLMRIAHATDAAGASFMTIFGSAEMVSQSISVTRLD